MPPQDPDAGTSDTTPTGWETWLQTQTPEVQAEYATHVAGLKKALEAERASNKESKGRLKKLADMEQAEEATRLAALNDQERLQASLTAKDAQVAQLLEQVEAGRKAIIGYEVRLAASKRGLVPNGDVLLLRLMDMSELTFDEAGQATNLTAVIDRMLKEFPFLKAPEGNTGSGLGTPGPRGPQKQAPKSDTTTRQVTTL